MKILHYSLGFPPYRTGGMTKFCVDLMIQQSRSGHQAALLWPGRMSFFTDAVSVKDRGIAYLDGALSDIRSYEVVNPLPVPYDEGIAEFQEFTKNIGAEVYSKFLESIKPDVIHIHTLMGLHKSFLMSAKEKGIKVVFTAHDFFPICPKVTLFRHGAVCSSLQSCSECGVCNATALGMKKIKLLQSPLYRTMKDFSLVRMLRKRHRDSYLSESASEDSAAPAGRAEDYEKLRSYYGSMLALMDEIHFNSAITKTVYETVFKIGRNCVIAITHADVADHRKIKKFMSDCLKIRYLGPCGGAKGFFYSRRRLTNYGVKDRIFA